MTLSTEATKGVTIALFAVGTLFLGFLPWWLGKYVKQDNKLHQTLLSLLLCFGGGVLMATCLLHMLGEVEKIYLNDHVFPLQLSSKS